MLEKTSRRNTKLKSTINKVGKGTVNFCKKPAKKSLMRLEDYFEKFHDKEKYA